MNTAAQLDFEPGPVMWLAKTPEPKLTIWVNNEPQPAPMKDAETGKNLAVSSFARGDSLEVVKPKEAGFCAPCTLPVIGYSYDSDRNLYAITPGAMPVKFRNAATEAGATETVFKPPLPETISEWCLVDYKGVFALRRYKYEPEVNPKTKQILIDFKAA